MSKLSLSVLVAFVLVLWLVSEFGPEEAAPLASIAGIGIAVIALLKLNKQFKEKIDRELQEDKQITQNIMR